LADVRKEMIGLVENFGLDFLNFRLQYAYYLKSLGYDVMAILPEDSFEESVREKGLLVQTYKLKKNSLDPISLFVSVRQFKRMRRNHNINLVHAFRLQPVIVSCIAFAFSGKVPVVAHITGLGYAFSSYSVKSIFYRIAILFLYQISLLFAHKIVVQNSSDFKLLSRLLFIKPKLILIESSGIDCIKFSRENAEPHIVDSLKSKLEYTDGQRVVTFTGRLLREKGILEFLEAAERISENGLSVKFVIAGWFDKNNPSCIPQEVLERYQKNKSIVYLGMIHEIKELLFISDIFVLPTYREGFPRSVLEAMSMALPVITTEVPGASEAVLHGRNGLLIGPRDTDSLINAIHYLLNNKEIAASMGAQGRERVESEYRNEIVYNRFRQLYVDV
jgi:glycosyltransferase involved in cell wall biosynthesis